MKKGWLLFLSVFLAGCASDAVHDEQNECKSDDGRSFFCKSDQFLAPIWPNASTVFLNSPNMRSRLTTPVQGSCMLLKRFLMVLLKKLPVSAFR